MRQLLTKSQYTFTPATSTITFAPPFDTLMTGNITLITNLSVQNTTIYQFNSQALGGTLKGANLVLTYNTSAMSATDDLQIFVDIRTPQLLVDTTLQEILFELRRISAMQSIFTGIEVKDSDIRGEMI